MPSRTAKDNRIFDS